MINIFGNFSGRGTMWKKVQAKSCPFLSKLSMTFLKMFNAAPVAEWIRSLTSVLLIIRSSHRCGFAPRTGHEFICETSHVLLAGVSGGFSPGTPVFAPPTD